MSGEPAAHKHIAPDVKLGRNVRAHAYVNLDGCEIGDETKIGPFVEVQRGAKIGERCNLSSHTFISEGVTIEPQVFRGRGVTFINVGAGSVAARDGLPNTTVTGNPAQPRDTRNRK